MIKAERKFLAHYIDVTALDPEHSSDEPNYIRIGKDLEEYTDDLQSDISSSRNILGENNVVHNGFNPQSDTELRIRYNDGIPENLAVCLMNIANERMTAANTTKVDVLVNSKGKVIWAYRENVVIIPKTIGGSTSGIVIGYSIAPDGESEYGSWDIENKQFLPDERNFAVIYDYVYAYLGKSHSPEIPDTYNGINLKKIGREVFLNKSDIEMITIPDGMEVIE